MIDKEIKKSDFKLEEDGFLEIESLKGIQLKDVYFKYRNRKEDTLKEVNIFIPYKSIVALLVNQEQENLPRRFNNFMS